MNIANKLTVLRILLVPVFVWLLLSGIPGSGIWATAVFLIASLTDLFDGYVARKRGEVTNFGKFADPIADKILTISAYVCLVELGTVPAWAVIIILAREFLVSGLRMSAASQNVVIAADLFGKLKTVIQMISIVVLVSGMFANTWFPITLFYISVLITFLSGATYLIKFKNILMK